MRRRKAVDRIIISLILLTVVVTAAFMFTKLKTDRIINSIESGEAINLLLMVHDQDDLLFSELLLFDSATGKGALFDIPGNIGSIINELKKMDRIDVLFDREKPAAFKVKISEILDIDIQYYLVMDIQDFGRIVDLFDGIKLFIANPVEQLDAENIVLLPSGNLVLDGVKTISYLEYDIQPSSTVENISKRQKVVQSLFYQISSNSRYLKDKEFISYLRSYVNTNLKGESFVSFLGIFKMLDIERIVFQRVLGNEREVGEKILLFPHYEGNLLRETVKQTVDSLANTNVLSAEELSVTIEILNATPQTGLAGRTSQVFRSFGYEISRVANFDGDDIDKTIVVSRNNDRSAAEKIADIILCKNISYDPAAYFDTNLITNESEITIILGKDFDGRYCKE